VSSVDIVTKLASVRVLCWSVRKLLWTNLVTDLFSYFSYGHIKLTIFINVNK